MTGTGFQFLRRFAVCLLIWGWSVGASAEGPPADPGASPTVAQASAPEQAGPPMSEAEATAKLNGSRWAIELRPMVGNEPAAPTADLISFEAGIIRSEDLSKRGYGPSPFTVSVADSGVAVWETMQTNQHDGVVLWRGELHGEKMLGSLSKYPLEGYSEDYVFEGSPAPAQAQAEGPTASPPPAVTSEAEPSAPKAEAATAADQKPAAPTPAAAQTDKPKKSRKGWFGQNR